MYFLAGGAGTGGRDLGEELVRMLVRIRRHLPRRV
jgi:hypothetical protein